MFTSTSSALRTSLSRYLTHASPALRSVTPASRSFTSSTSSGLNGSKGVGALLLGGGLVGFTAYSPLKSLLSMESNVVHCDEASSTILPTAASARKTPDYGYEGLKDAPSNEEVSKLRQKSSSPSSEEPTPSASSSPATEDHSQQAAFNPETGEINWDCPCLGGMADGPCGEDFKAAFSCFVYSEEEPKGIDCVEKFKSMQDCFRAHPEHYASSIAEDDQYEAEQDELDRLERIEKENADFEASSPSSSTSSSPTAAPLEAESIAKDDFKELAPVESVPAPVEAETIAKEDFPEVSDEKTQ